MKRGPKPETRARQMRAHEERRAALAEVAKHPPFRCLLDEPHATAAGDRLIDALIAHFGPMTLVEVGILFGVCRERIRQIQESALFFLRYNEAARRLYADRPQHSMTQWEMAETYFAEAS